VSAHELQALYQQLILDHSKARHGSAAVPLMPFVGSPIRVGGILNVESHQVNPTCGDELRMHVSIDEMDAAGARIESLEWSGDGCSISMASASALHDVVVGVSVSEATELIGAFRMMLQSRGTAEPDEELLGDAAAFVGVSRYPARVKCAMLAWVALEDVLTKSRSAA
jgi:nitrogen fixation NifU-like protein